MLTNFRYFGLMLADLVVYLIRSVTLPFVFFVTRKVLVMKLLLMIVLKVSRKLVDVFMVILFKAMSRLDTLEGRKRDND